MGDEILCTARFNGQASEGKALLESKELLFRGEFRLSIPLAQIRSVSAVDGELRITWPGGQAELDLGKRAEKWAAKIKTPKGLLDKLGIKPGQTVAVLGVEDEAFRAQLQERVGAFADGKPRKDSDAIFLSAEDRKALARLKPLQAYLKPDGALWTIRPKGSKAITEADVLAAGKAAGLVDVKVVAFSTTHTAEKFVIPTHRR